MYGSAVGSTGAIRPGMAPKIETNNHARSVTSLPSLDAARAKHLARLPATVGEFWTLHHEPLLKVGRIGTQRVGQQRWKTWVGPRWAHVAWSEIDAAAVSDWIVELRKTKGHKAPFRTLSPRSVRHIHCTLSGLLSHAVALGCLRVNPAANAKRYLPKNEPAEHRKHLPRVLTLDQAMRLILHWRVNPQRRAEFAFTILACTRGGETRGLHWGDLHLVDPVPWVRIAYSYDGPTKSGVSRDVPLHPELVTILLRFRDWWITRFQRVPKLTDLVFPTFAGNMRSRCEGDFKRQIAACQLPEITYHGLRHTGATLYRAAGVSRDDLGHVLGHVTKNQTDHYAPSAVPHISRELAKLSLLGANASKVVDVASGLVFTPPCTHEQHPPTVQESVGTMSHPQHYTGASRTIAISTPVSNSPERRSDHTDRASRLNEGASFFGLSEADEDTLRGHVVEGSGECPSTAPECASDADYFVARFGQ
jgi:integrase